MRVTTLHEVEEALGGIDPETLQEMAYRISMSHLHVCNLTSKIGGCAHTDEDTIRDRVDGLNHEELVALVAPTIWASAHIQPLLPA